MNNDLFEKKAENWFERAKRGEKGYAMIVRSNNIWYYISRDDVEEISAMTIIKTVEKKYKCFYFWKDEEMTKEKDFSIVIKNDQKLMLMDSEEGISAFGLSEADDNATDILIMFVAGGVTTTITASKDAPQIDIRYCVLSSSKDILFEILNHFYFTVLNEKHTETDVVEMRRGSDDISNE